MKKIKLCIFLFVIQLFFCQSIGAAGIDEAWYPDEFKIYCTPERGIIVEAGLYEIEMEHKVFKKEDYFMIPVKEVIHIGTREKENTIILKELEDGKKLVRIVEQEQKSLKLVKDEIQKTTTLFWKNNTLIFSEGSKEVSINGNKNYLYTEPYFIEDDVYISVKDVPLLFCIATLPYNESETFARWVYNGGETGERIDIKEMPTFVEKKYQFSGETGQLWELEKKEYVKTGGEMGRVFKTETKNVLLGEYSSYFKENEMMTEISFLPFLTKDYVDFNLSWNAEEKAAHIKMSNFLVKDIVIKAGSDVITVNQKQIKMPTAAEIKNDKLHIPFSVWLSIFEISPEKIQFNESQTKVTFLIKTLPY